MGDHTRIAAQIIPGIGFLMAGAIMRERGGVIGLTTAATNKHASIALEKNKQRTFRLFRVEKVRTGARTHVEPAGTPISFLYSKIRKNGQRESHSLRHIFDHITDREIKPAADFAARLS
jgi:hypothetical protein